MLRLTRQHPDPFALVILLEGMLDAHGVEELNVILREAGSSRTTSLDMSGLSGLDDAGRRVLVELRERGVRLEGGSLYIRGLLKEC